MNKYEKEIERRLEEITTMDRQDLFERKLLLNVDAIQTAEIMHKHEKGVYLECKTISSEPCFPLLLPFQLNADENPDIKEGYSVQINESGFVVFGKIELNDVSMSVEATGTSSPKDVKIEKRP